MRVAHLFDGIGGFHIASDRAGMDTLWVSEIDRHASAVSDHHWPHIKNLGDIHGIDNPPRVDVLTGGFPCQDYSVAGLRGGLAGDRGALWWEYHRLIRAVRPAWVVGENVPGLLSSRDGADFETIVGSLTELGYGVGWAVLDAQYFGVAQRRRRVFIVGHSGGEPRPEVLALGEGLYGYPAPRRETGPGVAALTETSAGGAGLDDQAVGQLIAGLSTFNWQSGGDVRLGIKEGYSDALHSGQVPAVAFSAGNSGDAYGIGYSEDHTPPLRSADSGTNQVPTVAAFGENMRGEVLESEYVRSVNVGGGKPGQGYPAVRVDSSVRRLTPTECECLQGFPDGWTDIPGNSDTQRYRQLGNAVAVPVVEWLLRRISACDADGVREQSRQVAEPPIGWVR